MIVRQAANVLEIMEFFAQTRKPDWAEDRRGRDADCKDGRSAAAEDSGV